MKANSSTERTGQTAGSAAVSKLRWADLYREAELYKAAVRLYTKPLFVWRKALSTSCDGKTLYDFARRGLSKLDALHQALRRRDFAFGPGVALRRNFNGKRRTLYIYPWEERLVDLLLFRLVNRALDGWFSSASYAYRSRGYGVNRCQRDTARELRGLGVPLYLMKRDIADFFDSIDHAILMDKLAALVDPNDYLSDLLQQRVRFGYRDNGAVKSADRGVPFGTAVACLFANVYLTGLDRRLEGIAGVRSFRYADDLLVLSRSEAALEAAARTFREEIAALLLTSKPSHESECCFAPAAPADGALETRFLPETGFLEAASGARIAHAPRFRHLGLEFRADGSIGLSRDKFRKILNLFRYAFRRARGRFRRTDDVQKRIELAVHVARRTVEQGVRNVAIIDYYLRHVTDEAQLGRLDRWLAEEVLALALHRGHKKANFRMISFRRLRDLGLPCLVHRRRLILHGHIEAPFFVWKNYQESKRHEKIGAREAVARPDASRRSAFSQSPEAAADAPL
jgi:hypothetical protein